MQFLGLNIEGCVWAIENWGVCDRNFLRHDKWDHRPSALWITAGLNCVCVLCLWLGARDVTTQTFNPPNTTASSAVHSACILVEMEMIETICLKAELCYWTLPTVLPIALRVSAPLSLEHIHLSLRQCAECKCKQMRKQRDPICGLYVHVVLYAKSHTQSEVLCKCCSWVFILFWRECFTTLRGLLLEIVQCRF